MKNSWARLVPLLVPACRVDTPVVEGPEDRLGKDLAAWCQSACDRIAVCDFGDRGSCASECVASVRETYVGNGDICSDAALRWMDCVDKASCAELRRADACNEREEEGRCLASLGEIACDTEGGASGGAANFCEAEFGDCVDGKVYRLSCMGPGDPPQCDCLIDDDVTGSFIPSRLECPEAQQVKQICGFPIANRTGDPEIPPLATCEFIGTSGVAGGGPVAECGATFDNCSDGHFYEVDCTGQPGAVDCACSVDGELLGSDRSAAGICPFIYDGDNGTAAANYACGFRITPLLTPRAIE